MPSSNSISFTHQLARFDEFIPRYYTEVVCANASLVDGRQHNPFRYHIVPMASHSSTVFSAMLAVSAVKMATKDPKFHRRALVHRHRVLVDVKRLLESDHIDTAKCLEALVSVVMLCWYDISDNCKSTWISHLVGIFGLLDVCLEKNIRSADYEGILHFSQQYLMYHLIMAKSTLHVDDVIPSYKHILSKLLGSPATTHKGRHNTNYAGLEGPYNAASRTMSSGYGNGDSTAQLGFRLVGPSFNDELDKIDTHQGFSNRLLLIINDICDLRDAQNSDESNHQDADTEALERRVVEIQFKLDTLTQVPPENIQVLEAGTNRDVQLEPEELRRKLEFITMTADSNRLAALLFLDETCATHLPHIVPQCRKNRSAIIQKTLSHVKLICETGPITAALPIWPVFVAGCMASTDDDRLQVMEIFDMFLSQKKFGSLPPALTVIKMVWRQRDLGSDENPRKILLASSSDSAGSCDGKGGGPTSSTSRRQRTRYPWERAISMLGGSSLLSLT
ncbi:fungal-specific transcription factor domain-containing protein [Daldinia decipiens]|uniref:fungal-specific transcription factor domain-containing protein n=1 Tax=Daldinia decipiens TaxID=326647 RepID=UPI0020C419BC|nr:fungal-specific transcription factor domain-containing protein [Daldinia decipiens]KAI1652699.1 fungal-specific transcription factor domain-containing protein [Daldinia decipiens]